PYVAGYTPVDDWVRLAFIMAVRRPGDKANEAGLFASAHCLDEIVDVEIAVSAIKFSEQWPLPKDIGVRVHI
ncbi:hypothetical protein, partial [Enterobacter hormaechei]|uniref:hypothetical protein n=1 Tax=Enterobacter hormaechei TaxID=158836 RepID=UPI00195348EC